MSSSTDTGIRAIDSWGLIKEFGLILREDKPIMITNWSGKKGQNILIITIKNVDVSFSIIIVRYTDKINSLLFTNISEKMTFQHFKYFSLFRDVLPHFFPTFSFSSLMMLMISCALHSVLSHMLSVCNIFLHHQTDSAYCLGWFQEKYSGREELQKCNKNWHRESSFFCQTTMNLIDISCTMLSNKFLFLLWLYS